MRYVGGVSYFLRKIEWSKHNGIFTGYCLTDRQLQLDQFIGDAGAVYIA